MLCQIVDAGRMSWAGQFVPGIDDLPLMAGLQVKPDGALHYDTPSGRIIDVQAQGQVSARKITEFYAETLPQLGWRPLDNAQYGRDNEILKIVIQEVGSGRIKVQFSVLPKAAK